MAGTAPAGNTSNIPDSRSIYLVADAECPIPMSGVEGDLSTVLRNTPFLFTRCTADLRYQYVSDAYARMLGLRPSRIVGKRIIDIIGENAFKTLLPHFRKVLQGHREDYEGEINFKSVGARRVRAIYTPERDNLGRIKGWIASMIDLPRQKTVVDKRSTMYQFPKIDRHCDDSADAPPSIA